MNVTRLTLRGGLALAFLVLVGAHASAAIVYVDATATNTAFAPSAGGGALVTNGTATVDGIWRARTNLGIQPSVTVPPSAVFDPTGGTVYESNGNETNPADNVPRLVTTVSAPAGLKDVYAYFWTNEFGQEWRIRASLTDSVDPLPLFIGGGAAAGTPLPVDTGGRDTAGNGGRRLYSAYLGQSSATALSVYVEDGPALSGTDRTWYDGLGYELAIPEPTSMVLFGMGLGVLLVRRRNG